MDPIDLELQSRHNWDAAFVQPDPSPFIKGNSPRARWLLWAHGAAALLARDKQRAGIWLQACMEIWNKEEHRADRLWVAEVFSGLSELSLLDGEYFDALRRSHKACSLWRSIETSLTANAPKPRKRLPREFKFGPKEYVDGAVSPAIQRPNGNFRVAGPAQEMVQLRAICKFLSGVETALRANTCTGRYDPGLVNAAEEFLKEHTDIVSNESRYKFFMAFGNQASAAGATKESIKWFGRAVEVYYQQCRDENDLYRLASAMFNKANALARSGEYDEALEIYHMISGDFERVGDYEAELRNYYAILHTRYKKGDHQGLEDELRNLLAAYYELIQEAADERRHIDTRNLDVVKSLLLTVIVSKPRSVENFLRTMALAERGGHDLREDAANRYFEIQNGTFSNWRNVGPLELLDAYLSPHPDSAMLMFESGADTLMVFALQGGITPLANRCYCAALSVEFVNAFTQLLVCTREENDLITGLRKKASDPIAERLVQHAKAVWEHLPEEIRTALASCKRLFVVLSPFGSISQFPVELIMTREGWLGLTHSVCYTNSVSALVASLSDNGTPRQVNATALVLQADDISEMTPLRHAHKEAEDVVRYVKLLGLESKGPVTLEPEQLIEELTVGHHLFHYVGHGDANVLGERLFLSNGRWLPSPWLRRIAAHRAPVTFLSACEMGKARLAEGSEKGFVLEMLDSGAPGVIAATRPVSDRVSGEIVRAIYAASRNNNSLPDAIQTARRKLDAEKMNPVCWSAYTFYGRPDASLKPNAQAEGELQWHQLLTRFLASGAQDHRKRALEALRKSAREDNALSKVEKLLRDMQDYTAREWDQLVSDLAPSDLVGALRLRVYIGVLRIEQSLKDKKFEDVDPVKEIGTAVVISLKILDSFAFVGAARRHCQLSGIIALNEIVRVLGHAVRLAEAMAAHDVLFKPAFEELTNQNQMYEGKVVMDVTKVVPQRML